MIPGYIIPLPMAYTMGNRQPFEPSRLISQEMQMTIKGLEGQDW